jgi:hypothetical protein
MIFEKIKRGKIEALKKKGPLSIKAIFAQNEQKWRLY